MKEMMIHILQKEEIDCGVACVHMLFRYYGYLLDYEWLRKEMIDSTNGTSLQNMVNILKKFNINTNVFCTNFEYLSSQYVSLKREEFPLIALIETSEKEQYHYILIYSLKKGTIKYSDPQETNVKKIKSSELIRKIKYLIKVDFSSFNKKSNRYLLKEKDNFIIQAIYNEKKRIIIVSILSAIISIIGVVLASKFGILLNAIDIDKNNILLGLYLSIFCMLLLLVVVFRGSITFFKNILSVKTIKNMEYNINKKIIEIFVDNKQNNVKRMKSGEVLARIGDSLLLSRTINDLLVNLLPDFIIMIFGIIYMFFLNVHLTLIMVGSCLLIAIIGWKTFNKIYRNNLKEMQNYADYNANLLETIQSLDEIKTNGSEKYYKKRVFSSLKNYIDSSADKENYGNYISILQNMFSIFFGIITIFIGINYVLNSQMTMGNLAIFVTVSEIIQTVILEVVLFQFQLEQFLTAYNRILQVFFEQNIKENTRNGKINVTNIKLLDFSISYGNKSVINNTNITLQGKNIFLLGKSGCGKSSIAKSIAGLADVYTGKILVNSNTKFENIEKCNVVYLSNESSLFTGTIRENICLGKIVANKTIENLCRNFAIDDYINNLPNKLEEKIKPNQSNLSTGQKQRIALIRAILSEPDILILDEALSNIDIENRINIVKSLEECDFMKIYISHDDLGIINASDYHIKNKKIVQVVG
mgnify:CR=1 FL=1